jgi:putative endonuclease
MLKNDFGKLYVGITKNVKERLHFHNSKQGAQFTKGNSVFQLMFLEEYLSMAEARSREVQIKKWRRDKKELLIQRFQDGLPTKLI